jgi:hypothetical protein
MRNLGCITMKARQRLSLYVSWCNSSQFLVEDSGYCYKAKLHDHMYIHLFPRDLPIKLVPGSRNPPYTAHSPTCHETSDRLNVTQTIHLVLHFFPLRSMPSNFSSNVWT